jgi:hypothetical protein
MGIVVPGASWRELFRGKPPRKEKEAEQKKGDIFNEVRKGTFLMQSIFSLAACRQ